MERKVEMDLNPETVCFIIDKAREFQAQEEVVLPNEPFRPTDDWALQETAENRDDPIYAELRSQIADLEPDQQVTLVALMWLGRGDYDVEEWDQALEEAGEAWNRRTAEYLIGTPLVADYLQEGLLQLGYSCGE